MIIKINHLYLNIPFPPLLAILIGVGKLYKTESHCKHAGANYSCHFGLLNMQDFFQAYKAFNFNYIRSHHRRDLWRFLD
jgi:hypothetical protein